MLPGSSTPEPGLTKKGKKRGRPPKSETGESAAKRRDTKNAAGAATATGAKKGIKRTKEEVRLYCTCKQPFVSPRYMLPCEGCQEWYHGECVGLDRTRGEWLDLYYCAKCTSAVMHTTCAKSQLNLQVDRDDQARLQAMRRERDAIRDRVAVVERRKAFLSVVMERLSDVDTKKECRFDSRLVCPSQTWRVVRSASLDESAEGGVRLDFSVDDKEAIPASLTKYTICPKLGKCLRHEGWQQLKALEIEQDRTMEIAALARLNRERQHIKARMRLRRQNASAKSQAFMENGTIVHNAS
ncbi:hypothetical protein BCR43DRAFT_430847 [Syncephalastrum racemosum]|uniref:Zinc finger PHD-type domain-containing protein n=1 Tax=Syncephalastrum racemosum TaxID=13706 RepID=A0A1X2HRN3_SYNRA|nr:hypothetical protein BCR43DRAFT_430847 [Syncephalastrum racemosum]